MDWVPNFDPIYLEGGREPFAKYLDAAVHLPIFTKILYLTIMMTSVEIKRSFATPGHQRVLKLRGDAQQIFVNGEFSGGFSGFWDYTVYVNPYMVVRPEGHYTKHIYVNSERIASKIGNPEDFGAGDPTGQGDAVGRKIKMEEVVEENFNELFGSVPEIEPAAEEQLGMSSGSSEPELNSYWFTSDHLVSLSLDKYGKVAVDFCSNQGARKEHSPSYATEEQRRVEQKDQDLVRLDLVIMTLRSSAFVTDGSGVAIQHLEYMAFGEVFVDQRRTGFGMPYKFNPKELDCESGYYYYSARYYDPRMARFLSVDPLAGEMPEWGSYTYTFNNPLKYIDPTGMGPEETDDWVYGASRGIYWDENATSQASTKDGEVYLGDGFATVSDNGLQTNYNSDRSFDHNSTDDGNLPTITVTGYKDSKLEQGASAVSSGLGFKNEVLKRLELGEAGSKYLKYSKGLGMGAAAISLYPTITDAYSYYDSGGNNWQVGFKAGLDIVMTATGTLGGPIGFTVASAYFVADVSGVFGNFGKPVIVNQGQ